MGFPTLSALCICKAGWGLLLPTYCALQLAGDVVHHFGVLAGDALFYGLSFCYYQFRLPLIRQKDKYFLKSYPLYVHRVIVPKRNLVGGDAVFDMFPPQVWVSRNRIMTERTNVCYIFEELRGLGISNQAFPCVNAIQLIPTLQKSFLHYPYSIILCTVDELFHFGYNLHNLHFAKFSVLSSASLGGFSVLSFLRMNH